jgi:hypothetical protein
MILCVDVVAERVGVGHEDRRGQIVFVLGVDQSGPVVVGYSVFGLATVNGGEIEGSVKVDILVI